MVAAALRIGFIAIGMIGKNSHLSLTKSGTDNQVRS